MANYIAVPITVATTGANGAASGSAVHSGLSGKVHHVVVIPGSTAPATTKVDVDIVLNDDSTSLQKILNLAATNAVSFKSPRLNLQDTTGTNQSLSGTNIISEWIVLAGLTVKVSVTLSNALSPAVTVYLILEV